MSHAASELVQQIVFVSADECEEDFHAYYKDMPFCAVPFTASKARQALARRLEITGYPTLVMLSPELPNGDRDVINTNVRGVIEDGDYMADFPFQPKTYGSLQASPEDINDHRCLIVFHEMGDDDDQQEVRNALRGASNHLGSLKCFWVLEQCHVSKSLRQAVGLPLQPTHEPAMVLLDIPEGGLYCRSSCTEITVQNVLLFTQSPGTPQALR